MEELTMKKFVKNMLAGAMAAVLAVSVLTGCSSSVKPADYATTVVATLGDEKIYLDEANMYLRSNQYYYEMMYTYMYGTSDIWDMEIATGVTMADSLRENTMATLRQTYILCSHAEELGVSLSDADMAKVEQAADESLEQSDATLLEAINMSRDRIIEVIAKNALANRVWEAVVAAADTNVSDEEARCVGASYVKVTEPAADDEEEETKSAKVTAQEIYDAVRGGSTLSEAAEAAGLTATSASYFTGDTFDEGTLGAKALSMEEGAVELFEIEDDGWYVMVLDSALDEDATASKKESIISERQTEVFNAKYAEWQEASPAFKVVDKVWESVPMDPVFVAEEETAAEETTAGETSAEETSAEETTAEETAAEETTQG